MSIQPLAVREVTTEVGQLGESRETTVLLPPGILAESLVEIRLRRSIASGLLSGLAYVTGFPYGCVEQTMSKALPNAVVGRALFQLGVSDPTLAADLPPRINAGVQRLYGYQHNDGSWGWWYDDDTDDYQTAWVVFGLATTAEAGYEIDPLVIERGIDYLTGRMSNLDPRTRAFALFAMAAAGLPNEAETLLLAEESGGLDPFSQAALALALMEMDKRLETEALLDLLVESVETDGNQAYWSVGVTDGAYRRKTMASSTRSTALALSTLSRIRPGSELEQQVVRWLMDQRTHHGWGTTNETAFAIIGLTDHILATQEAAGDSSAYQIWLNGDLLADGALLRAEPSVTVSLPTSELHFGQNALRLEQQGNVPLYYVISSELLLDREEIEAAGTIEVERSYKDAATNRTLESFRPGQLVEIAVTITLPEDASYMLVEDRLPAGLEALNEGLKTTSHVVSVYDQPTFYWESLGYNNKEVHSDRVTFFITETSSGQHLFTYLARATQNGSFTALPTEAYAMYDLTLWGQSTSNTIFVQPEETACPCGPDSVFTWHRGARQTLRAG